MPRIDENRHMPHAIDIGLLYTVGYRDSFTAEVERSVATVSFVQNTMPIHRAFGGSRDIDPSHHGHHNDNGSDAKDKKDEGLEPGAPRSGHALLPPVRHAAHAHSEACFGGSAKFNAQIRTGNALVAECPQGNCADNTAQTMAASSKLGWSHDQQGCTAISETLVMTRRQAWSAHSCDM